jgi:2-polyprenyl-3-methyl-5-hydroxy-6-metoxy-1,4-benzoquinol methylase
MMASITKKPVPGGWSDREVAVGPHQFKLYTPTDPDEVLNHIESPEAATKPHLADPYWAKLWPAAPLLAEAVLRAGPKSKVQSPRSSASDFGLGTLDVGLRTLELGCGSGLVGIAALASGCEVTFSDYIPFAVELAVENAARNGFPNARGMVLDWRQPQNEEFPWIVAADVTYDRTNIDPLLDTCEKMLAPGGEAWFGDAGRGPAAEFLSRALDRGWQVSLFDENDRPALVPALGRYQRIVLKRQPSA